MNLIDAQALALAEMAKYKLLPQWKFKFDYAVRRYGFCSGRTMTISLSEPLTLLNDEAHVHDTILHEIAHALVGARHHHDAVWKAKCVEIGARPVRCGTGAVTPDKFVAVCVCGKVFSRVNKPKRGKLVYCLCQEKKNPRKYLQYKRV